MDIEKRDLVMIEKGYSFDPFCNPTFTLAKSTIKEGIKFFA
jgi:hypothetical protein